MNEKQKLLEAELVQCWRELDEQILGLKGADFYNTRTANDVIMIVRPLFDRIFRAGFDQLADEPATENTSALLGDLEAAVTREILDGVCHCGCTDAESLGKDVSNEVKRIVLAHCEGIK